MKYFENNKKEYKAIHRIIWDERSGAFVYRNSGKEVGKILIDDEDDILNIKTGNVDYILEELNLKNSSISQYMTDEISLRTKYTASIHHDENDNQLPYGVFNVKNDLTEGILLKPYKSNIIDENIIDNKGLKKQVYDFFNEEPDGRKKKKGFLLYGPPGNGKTSEIMSLFNDAEKQKIRIFLTDSHIKLDDLNEIKFLLELDKTIFIFEELTERIEKGTEDILTFLDGENSWNNCVAIATTNHPEELPSNLVDRPGRFSVFIEYNNPDTDQIVELGNKFGFNDIESKTLSKQKLSFDYVSYIFSLAKKQKLSPKEVRDNEEKKRSGLSNTFKGKIGFN